MATPATRDTELPWQWAWPLWRAAPRLLAEKGSTGITAPCRPGPGLTCFVPYRAGQAQAGREGGADTWSTPGPGTPSLPQPRATLDMERSPHAAANLSPVPHTEAPTKVGGLFRPGWRGMAGGHGEERPGRSASTQHAGKLRGTEATLAQRKERESDGTLLPLAPMAPLSPACM